MSIKKRFIKTASVIFACSLCGVSAAWAGPEWDQGPDSYGGPGDDFYDDGGYYDDYDHYDDYGYPDDYGYYDDYGYDDGYDYEGGKDGGSSGGESSDGYYDDYYSGVQVSESELATWNTGLGSATELDGNIVVISIFADDKNTSWDFSDPDDQTLRSDSLEYLKIATDWITENGKKWGADPEFIYDWTADPDLCYETKISEDITSDDSDPTPYIAQLIEQEIDVDELLSRYNADSILYLAYINTPLDNECTSFTLPYDDTSEYTCEVCYMMLGCDGEEEAPAAYAHEMLHAFGAPDLYTSEYPEYNYNIDGDYVRYCESAHANEIMVTTYDVDTYEAYYDHISNELTDITAYYVGWTDECQDVEDFNLQQSQHILAGK